jgi:D-glycero-D-manno-heptose 1,7-bisphosphate phosphatase
VKLVILERSALVAPRAVVDSRPPPVADVPAVALEAVARLTHGGYHVALASHQANVARGLLEMTTVNANHRRIARQVEEAGGRIDAVAVCPHAPDAGCRCRMPQPGMLLDLIERFDATAAATVMVAASDAAVAAGLAAGCLTWRMRAHGVDADATVPAVSDLNEVAMRLLAAIAPAASPNPAGRAG